MILSFDEWYAQNEENLWILWAETGRDREFDFNADNEFEEAYSQYLTLEEERIKQNDLLAL